MHAEARDEEELVISRGPSGLMRATPRKKRGYGFAEAPPEVRGYVLSATLVSDTQARVRMPGTWIQVLNAFVSLQVTKPVPGYVQASQRDIISEFKIASGHVGDAMSYWQAILWIRRVGRGGRYQLSPWLFFKGNSSLIDQAKDEWLAATGGLVCYIPAPGHPYEWLAERKAGTPTRGLPLASHQLTLIDRPSHRTLAAVPAPRTDDDSGTEPEVRAQALEALVAERLARAATAQDKVEAIYTTYAGNVTPSSVMRILQRHDQAAAMPRDTVKSCLRRIRERSARTMPSGTPREGQRSP
ncbi:hypothetical protein AB0C84_42000 [Actinomadura sp. NPDC048955]|uniref:hypothetical protein n=1 Tax=Actinomadura sp. NPDC048955 TaxID=3158228 RepID=UPI0033E5CDC2